MGLFREIPANGLPLSRRSIRSRHGLNCPVPSHFSGSIPHGDGSCWVTIGGRSPGRPQSAYDAALSGIRPFCRAALRLFRVRNREVRGSVMSSWMLFFGVGTALQRRVSLHLICKRCRTVRSCYLPVP